MAKMCLVDYRGFIEQIVEPGEEFEIYTGSDAKLKWVLSASDDVTLDWIMKEGVFVERIRDTNYTIQRQVAYGSIGDQLDMLYKDQINGTTTFRDHIAAVKAANPAPADQPDSSDISPTGTEEKPAWEG